MTKQEILRHIDHTQLKAFCTWEDIKNFVMKQLSIIPLLYVFHHLILRESRKLMAIKLIFVL